MQVLRRFYFGLKTAVIDGDITNAQMYAHFLSEYSDKQLDEALHPEWKSSYITIRENVKRGILLDSPPVGKINAKNYSGGEIAKSQNALVAMIVANPQPLFNVLGIDNPGYLCPEYPTTNGERVDLLTDQAKEIRFPIEVKIDRADHETIGQIRKYGNYF